VRDQKSFKISGEGPWHQEVHEFGVNYRLPDILCALGSSQLKKIEEFKKRRSDIFDFYNSRLAENDQIKLPTKSRFNDPMWHLYPIQVNPSSRLEIFNFLRRNGVLVQVNYLPAYRHPVFGMNLEDFAKFPGSEEFYAREISLPMNTYIEDSELEYVANKVLEAVSMYGNPTTLN
jgi:dTDP-4-amino-4,6-dideoxygalactose transaminase